METEAPPTTGSRVLSVFILGRLLGQGGFAQVFELFLANEPTAPLAAAKVILKSRLQRPSTKAKLRFEILNHSRAVHPHIVGFLGVHEDEQAVYILTELCPSGTLKDVLRHRKHLSEYEVRSWGLQLLSAI